MERVHTFSVRKTEGNADDVREGEEKRKEERKRDRETRTETTVGLIHTERRAREG